MPGLKLLLQTKDLCLNVPKLFNKRAKGGARQDRYLRVVGIFNPFDESCDLRCSLPHNNAELAAVPSQSAPCT